MLCYHCVAGEGTSLMRCDLGCRLRLKCDGTRAETRCRLSAKRTSPLKSAGSSVQSITGSRGVRISGSNAGYTMYWLPTRFASFPLHFPSRASPCAITFQLDSTCLSFSKLCHVFWKSHENSNNVAILLSV